MKQVIVMRKDLKMRRGKEIAQGAHASMKWLTDRVEKASRTNTELELSYEENYWLASGTKKVCLQVESEKELMEIFDNARALGFEVHLVIDSGLTEFDGVPTKTCIAIGPDDEDLIDEVTGDLKLY